MNIFEVLSYGPIVAQDDDLGILITANGSYLNFWVLKQSSSRNEGFKESWENTDVRSFDLDHNECPNGIMSLTLLEVITLAEYWIKEVRFIDEIESEE
jgi:hypothetical protein